MKKLLIIAAVVAAMAACTKSQVVYEDSDQEIGLSPVNYTATKTDFYGPVESTVYPHDEEFNIFALYTEAPSGTEFSKSGSYTSSMYLSNATFTARDNIVWGGVTPYYWPKTGSLYFTGYSPATAPQTADSELPGYTFNPGSNEAKLTFPNFLQGAYSYTDGTSTPSEDSYTMVDFMYFDVAPFTTSVNYSTGSGSGYPVTFKHALSWLTFKFGVDRDQINGLFTITKVTLKQVKSCATFTSGAGDIYPRPAWSGHVKANDIVLYDNTVHNSKGSNVLTYADGAKFTIDDILIIPQAIYGYGENGNYTLEVQYTQRAAAGEAAVQQIPATFKLSGGNGEGENDSEWLINKHYTYNITFTADNEILIAPSVDEWDDVNKGAIEL